MTTMVLANTCIYAFQFDYQKVVFYDYSDGEFRIEGMRSYHHTIFNYNMTDLNHDYFTMYKEKMLIWRGKCDGINSVQELKNIIPEYFI